MDLIAAQWREALLTTVAPHVGTPLFLSGGMDSRTLLAAQVELGSKPDCYTFKIGENESKDLLAARNAARYVGSPLTEVKLSDNVDDLANDVREVIRIIGRSGKAAVQCSHPILHMSRVVKRDGHSKVMIGTGGVCEDNRKCQIAARAKDWEKVQLMRTTNIDSSTKNPKSATWAMLEVARLSGLESVEPYATEPLRSAGLSISYSEINSPKQKGIALRSFPEFYKQVSWRGNVALQIGSGLREFHDLLLESKYNTRQSLAVVAIYNDFAKVIL